MKRTVCKNALKNSIKAAVTLSALTMDYSLITDDISFLGYENPQTLLGTLSKLLYSTDFPAVSSALLLAVLALFYMYLDDLGTLTRRQTQAVAAAAFFAAFCAMTGKLFYVYKDIWLLVRGTVQCFKGLLVLAGLFVFFCGLIKFALLIYIRYCDRTPDQSADSFAAKLFHKKHAELLAAALILAAWLPTIAAYYPAVFMGDSEDIIYMAYNVPSGIETSVLPLKEGIYITNHHPVLYTAYVSLILHTARALGGSWNFGIFLCAVIQCLITVRILSYSCIYCAKQLKREQLALAAVLLYAFLPWMPKYAIMISKDTFFADFLLLWAILLHKAVCSNGNGKALLALTITGAGVVLIRKNGIYIILLTLIFTAALYRKLWKRWFLPLAAVIAVNVLFSHMILPAAGIPEGSVREMLSVPFQQTARYVKYHADEVTDAQRHAIEGVLDYGSLAQKYSGGLSDPVKNTYNKYASGDALKAYFRVWLQMLFKHPEEYIVAFCNNYYGYFYPVVNDAQKLSRTSVGSMANVNRDGYFDFSHCYDKLHVALRDALVFYDLMWMHIPVLKLFMTSAAYVWVVIVAFFLECVRRDRAALPAVFLYLALMLTVLMGPSNAINYERYVFPCILAMPFLICLSFSRRCANSDKSAGGKE